METKICLLVLVTIAACTVAYDDYQYGGSGYNNYQATGQKVNYDYDYKVGSKKSGFNYGDGYKLFSKKSGYGDYDGYQNYQKNNYDYNYGYNKGYKKSGYGGNYYGYEGFKIIDGRFSYHDKVYKLSCTNDRFYSAWKYCWDDCHDRNICFDRLYKQNLFAPYVAVGGYGGLKIVDGRFSYRGNAYKLSCTTEQFYSAWRSCWDGYHSRSTCFERLYKKHLFVIVGDGYGGFKIVDGRFSYHSKEYKLSCTKERFYDAWKGCWNDCHDRKTCFDRLYNQHLFAPYVLDVQSKGILDVQRKG